MHVEPSKWSGPVLSGYGVHLVYVHELLRAPAPAFADVEPKVLEDWQREQQERFNAEFYESLKNQYDIVIAEPPTEMVLADGSQKSTRP